MTSMLKMTMAGELPLLQDVSTVEPPIKDTIEKKTLFKGHTIRSQSSTFLLY